MPLYDLPFPLFTSLLNLLAWIEHQQGAREGSRNELSTAVIMSLFLCDILQTGDAALLYSLLTWDTHNVQNAETSKYSN